jgi:hypothetical protein
MSKEATEENLIPYWENVRDNDPGKQFDTGKTSKEATEENLIPYWENVRGNDPGKPNSMLGKSPRKRPRKT